MDLARLCTEIQRNVELSIIKIAEDCLTKQNKRKNGTKNKTNNKKILNYKPRFTPREHKPTSPIHTSPPTDTTTVTQNTKLRFKEQTFNTNTLYAQPTHKNHASTCTKSQLLPQYTTAFHCQPNTHRTLKRIYTHAPSINYHSSKRRLSPHPQPILQPIYNTTYHSK